MPALLRTLLLGLIVSGLAACSTLQPVDTPTIELPPGSAISDPQIEQAILNALNTYRWHVGQVQPGRVQADILVREAIRQPSPSTTTRAISLSAIAAARVWSTRTARFIAPTIAG